MLRLDRHRTVIHTPGRSKHDLRGNVWKRESAMRFSIALALATLLFMTAGSAQQTLHKTATDTARDNSALPLGPVLGGDGTKNYIPLWITPSYLQSSVIYQASGGNVGVGTTTPQATFDVAGNINAQKYEISGTMVVRTASDSLYVGQQAGYKDLYGSSSTFVGYQAGYNNSGDNAYANSFFGVNAGYSNIGGYNSFFGTYAGQFNTSGEQNTFVGGSGGRSNTTGTGNTFVGYLAGFNNTTGSLNTSLGQFAGSYNTTGIANSFLGAGAGDLLTTGSYNTFVGFDAGQNNKSGDNNIYIGSLGCVSPCPESNAIRIGGNTETGPQTAAYISGIYGSTLSSGISVYVNPDGQLGTQTSSLRFKEQVRDMGDSTNALMKLRPVTFLYKPEYDRGERTLQYGLIAEEVAKVYPELVAYDNDGQPYSVRYQYLTTMLLNEAQKQYRRAEAEAKVVTEQEQKIDDLEQRLSRLEKLVGGQAVAQK